ncbi:MAG: regulatory protein RecX [Lachnospiraceae bacterium]
MREQEELSEESYREIMQEVLPKRATLRCMNLLQSRAYTESKLRSKLKEGGYPQESIDSALAYVKSYHYVDDLQFAKDYIVNQAGKKSKRVLEQDLIARGVSRDEIEAAFAEAAEKGDGPDELALAQMWLAKKRYDPAQADFTEKRKAAAFLYRKGISAETVRKAMELAGEL